MNIAIIHIRLNVSDVVVNGSYNNWLFKMDARIHEASTYRNYISIQ